MLAAHPDDGQRLAEGVADDRIIPRLAIRACEQAAAESDAEPRLTFQLGRALQAAARRKDAVRHFRKAAEAGHAAAWAYLGDAYQFGHDGTVDFQKAFEAYGKAFDGGFEKARGLLEMMSFDAAVFTSSFLGDLYAGDLREANAKADAAGSKAEVRAHLFSFVQKALSECDKVIAPASVRPLYRLRYGDLQEDAEASLSVSSSAAAGEFDAQTFVRRHGCDGPVAKSLFGTIDQFLTAR